MTPFFRRITNSEQNMTPEMIFLYVKLHIMLMPRNVKICEHSIFFQLLTKNMFYGSLNLGFIDISLINSDILIQCICNVIFKFRNSDFDLKGNSGNNNKKT